MVDEMRTGIPVTYDADGKPVMPKFAPKEDGELDYLGYSPDVAETFVSCICTSEKFFHLRWAYFDDDPSEDDGKTICGANRGRDKSGFWRWGGRCGNCVSAIRSVAEDIGEDLGWYFSEAEI